MKSRIKSFVKSIIRGNPVSEEVPTAFELNDLSYGRVVPNANYAPWQNDHDFMELYNKCKENTLVDIYRCYELWTLVGEVLKVNNNLNIIEIGVWRGGTAAVMSKKMKLTSAGGTLYLADTFTGVVKTGEKDSYYTGGEHNDTSLETVEKLFGNFGLKNYEILTGIFPEETAGLVSKDAPFGLCHIDVDVYKSAEDCLNWVWDKLVIGGVVVFDDFGFHTCNGVTKLVEEQKPYKDRLVIHNLNGHGLIVKIK